MKPLRTPRNVHGQHRRHGGNQDHDFQEEYLYSGAHMRRAGFDDLIKANDGYGRAYTRYDHGFSDYHRRDHDFYNEGGRYISPTYGNMMDERMRDWPESSSRNWRYLHDPARRITGTDRRVQSAYGDPFAHRRPNFNPYVRRGHQNYEGDDLVGGLSDERSGYDTGYTPDDSMMRRREQRRGRGSQDRHAPDNPQGRRVSHPSGYYSQNPEWDL